METKAGLIFKKIPLIMAEVGSIEKERSGTGVNYKFRGIDDFYKAFQLVLAKHGCFATTEVLESTRSEKISKSGGTLFYSVMKIKYDLFAEDGSKVTSVIIGEGMDSSDKASNKAMAVAHKYFFAQLFTVPTSDAKDPEDDTHDVVPYESEDPRPAQSQPAPKKPATEAPKAPTKDPRLYIITFGNDKGRTLGSLSDHEADRLWTWLNDLGTTRKGAAEECFKALNAMSRK